MTSPFAFSTHSAHSQLYSLPTPKPPRPPIHNPYDKFTQPEFDAWIGGITGALKRALGQEDEAEEQSPSYAAYSDDSSAEGEDVLEQLLEDDDSVDEEVNDSFAEIRARRVVGKGKARDPRDGPGFGAGDQHEPIEIGSDSEDESQAEEEEEEEEGSEEWDEEGQSGEEEEQLWGKGESSAQARTRHEKERLNVDEDEDGVEYEEEDQSDQGEESGDDETEVRTHRKEASPVLVLSSDEELEEGEDEDPSVQEDNEGEGSDVEYSDEDESESTSALVSQYPRSERRFSRSHHAPTSDGEQLAHTSPRLEDVNGVEDMDDIEELQPEDVQPLSKDTSFPPPTIAPDAGYPIEIPDPWSGPRTYAEDYYSGGDFLPTQDASPTADRLGAAEKGDVIGPRPTVSDIRILPEQAHIPYIEEIAVEDITKEERPLDEENPPPPLTTSSPAATGYYDDISDPWLGPSGGAYLSDSDIEINSGTEETPLDEGNSSPPRTTSAPTVTGYDDISDPWLGPSGGAYFSDSDIEMDSGSHLGARQSGGIDASTSNPASRSETPALKYVSAVNDVEDDEQPSLEDTSFPPPIAASSEYPVEILDPWEGPATYAEDYFAGGEVFPKPGVGLSADHLGVNDDHTTQSLTALDEPGLREDLKNTVELDMRVEPAEVKVGTEGESSTKQNVEGQPSDTVPVVGPVQQDEQGILESSHIVVPSSVKSPVEKPVPGKEEFEMDMDSLYGDLQVEPFMDIPVDLSGVDWEYATAFLNGLPAPITNQQTDSHVVETQYSVGIDEKTGVIEGENNIQNLGSALQEVEQSGAEVILEEDTMPRETEKQEVDNVDEVAPAATETVPQLAIELVEEATASVETDIVPAIFSDLSLNHHQDLHTLGPQSDQEIGLPTPSSERSGAVTPPPVSELMGLDIPSTDVTNILEPELLQPDTSKGHGAITVTNAVQNKEVEQDMDLKITVGSEPETQVSDLENDTEQETLIEIVAGSTPHERLNENTTTLIELSVSDPDAMKVASSQVIKAEAHFTPPAGTNTQSTQNEVSVLSVSKPQTAAAVSTRVNITMPVCADPTIPDPTSQPRTPLILSSAGTPGYFLSPVQTPEPGKATPVSVPIPPSILQALRKQHPRRAADAGLFTPVPTTPSEFVTPEPGEDVKPDEPSTLPDSLSLQESSKAEDKSAPAIPEILGDSVKTLAPREDTVISAAPTEDAHSLDIEPAQLSSTPRPTLSRSTPSNRYSMRVVMRKATDPILFSDPYPYSLSTPQYSTPQYSYSLPTPRVPITSVKHIQDEALDEDTEQGLSMTSSSTVEKEKEEKESDAILDDLADEDVDGMENMELRYPSLQPNGVETTENVASTATTEEDSSVDVDNDTDADGDLDPDFVEAPDKIHTAITPLPTEPESVAITKPSQENNSKGKSSVRHSQRSALAEHSSKAENQASTSHSNSDEELPAILIIKKPAKAQNSIEGYIDSDGLTDLDEFSSTPVKSKLSRPSKRRRSSSIHVVSPLTRSVSSKKFEQSPPPPPRPAKKPKTAGKADAKKANGTALTKGKTKMKQLKEVPYGRSTFDTRSISSRSSSGASSTSQMLHDSRSTSRASSIMSNAPGDGSSSAVEPSPTLHKGTKFRPQIPPPPPPFLHKHSHTLPHLQLQVSRPQRPVPKAPTPATRSDVPQASEPAVTKPTPSQAGPSHRAPVYFRSPVTRSNCRYHKISIPREEDGPRIFFLVPGCSLGDHELIEEEEIIDHGDATPEDGRKIMQDLDSLAFDPYLIGVLRLLVGVDLLREQEVYYLPQPGEELVPKRRPHKAEKSTLSKTSSADHSTFGGSPRPSTTSARSPLSSKAPASTAGSTSTNASAARKAKASGRDFSPGYSESDLSEEEDLPDAKRLKPSPVEGTSSAGSMGPPTSDPRWNSQHLPRKSEGKPNEDVNPDAPSEHSKHRKTSIPERAVKRKKR